MTTWIDKAKDQLAHHEQALHIIEAIAKLVKETLVKPDSNAFAVLQAIEKAIDTLTAGFDGRVNRAEVDKQIRELVDRFASDDAAIDARIAARARAEAGGTDDQ